jgi:hypothetical protein
MRHRLLLLLACALAPALASADEPAPPAAAPAESPAAPAEATPPAPPVPAPAEAPYPRFGLAVGAGVPQAATLDLLYRPVPWLRLSAGPTWDYVGWGLHGGLVLAPFRWVVSPTVGVEAGRMFEVDLNKIASVDPGLQPLLQHVNVQYLATTLGVEVGSQRGFAFSLRAGLAWLQTVAHGTGQITGSGGASGQNDAVITVTSPRLRASTPTVQLACQYFF